MENNMPFQLQRAPSVAELNQKFAVNVPNTAEATTWMLYDYQTIAATAPNSQRFFNRAIGESGVDEADTNMENAGSLPKGQAFLITGISVYFAPAGPITTADLANALPDDVYDFYKDGALELWIGSKNYQRIAPLMALPPKTGLKGAFATVTTATTTEDNYAWMGPCGPVYAIKPIALDFARQFYVDIKYRNDISAAARGGVQLHGFLYRDAQ